MTSKSKSFLTHAAVYGLGMFAVQAASIVLLPLYTGYLTPAEFGVLEILNRIGEVVVICLTVNGIRMAVLTFFCQAQDEREREQIAVTVSLFLLIVVIGCGALVFCFADELAASMGIDSRALLVFGVVTVLIEAIAIMPLAFMQARLQSIHYVCTTLAMCVCRITLAIIAVAGLGWGVWGVLASSAVTSGVIGGVLTVRECLKGSIRPNWSKFVQIARYAAPFVPGGIFFFVLHNGDRFFLVRTVGAEQLGLYALGYKLAIAAGMVSSSPLHMVWGARMYKTFEEPEASTIIGRVYTRILAAYLFVGIGLCMLQDEVVAVLGSSEYAGATAVLAPLVLAYFFLNGADLMDSAFYVRRRTGLKPWIAAFSTAVILGLYSWLIPHYGAQGAAYATLAGFFFHAVATYAVSQRVFPVRYEFVRTAGMLGLAIAFVLAARCLGSGLATVPAKLALCAAWPVLLWITGVISEQEKRWAIATIQHVRSRLRRVSEGKAVGPTANTAE